MIKAPLPSAPVTFATIIALRSLGCWNEKLTLYYGLLTCLDRFKFPWLQLIEKMKKTKQPLSSPNYFPCKNAGIFYMFWGQTNLVSFLE